MTAYADRLLADLDGIDWPGADKADAAQLDRPLRRCRTCLSRSMVTPVRKCTFSRRVRIPCSASRSWCSHRSTRWLPKLPRRCKATEVEDYVAQARRQSEVERLSTVKEKTGVFTGAYARNLFTSKEIPIWIADYVLMGYGTGAIMAAPGEDQRDFEFAQKYGLEIPVVTAPADRSTAPADRAFTGYGVAVNSGFLNGMRTEDAIQAVCKYATEHEIGRSTVSYRMRDWLISRQRYWGCPIPIVYCKKMVSSRCPTSSCR